MITVSCNSHTISIHYNILTGSTKVYYDGNLSLKGGSPISGLRQSFFVKEDGENTVYEVEQKLGLLVDHFTIRRNGVPVYVG